jgi:hypothetical protein
MSDIQFNTGVIRPVDCFKEGWEHIKSDFWLLFGITLVGGLIGGASMLILAGGMYCGIFYCYLKKIDGGQVTFDDLWKGFNWWVPGLAVAAVIFVPIIAEYFFVYISLVGAIVAGANLGGSEMFGLIVGAMVIHVIILFVMVCFHTLLVFAFPLVADRGLGPIMAIKTSARAVWNNLSGVVGIILCGMGLIFVGYLAFCVGVYFTIPIIIAGNLVAYRKLFPALPPGNFNPPPPNAYSGV